MLVAVFGETSPVPSLPLRAFMELDGSVRGWLLHATARHPADRRLAGLRPLVLTRPSGPNAVTLYALMDP